MTFFKCGVRCATLTVLELMGSAAAYGQVNSINSDIVSAREFNDVPGAGLNIVNDYPSFISFNEQGVSALSGFSNRDVWRFSTDGGTSAYQFQNDDFFSVSMQVRIPSSLNAAPEKAGFLFDATVGQGEFIVDTDAHEIVAFGGVLPFYSFYPQTTYNAGDTITLGLTYFLDGNGKRAIIYSADGAQSPILEFTNTKQGITDHSTLGGFFEIRNDSTNSDNSGSAVFENVSIASVPEPSSLVLATLGFIALAGWAWRRRSRAAWSVRGIAAVNT